MSNKNYFLDPERASLYRESRPSFHAKALKEFHQKNPEILYEAALDVGCGTGQSAVALSEWTKKVFAIDNSQAMLDHAIAHEKVQYQLADAESMPFPENSFDLIFVASSFHWLEKRKFFSQVQKVLRASGKFLIYDSFVHAGLSKEFHKAFSDRFPRPFQDVRIVQGELDFFDLKFVKLHTFNFSSDFKTEDVIKYFYNLSNVSAAIERGEDPKSAFKAVEDIVQKHLTGTDFGFQVLLSEIVKS